MNILFVCCCAGEHARSVVPSSKRSVVAEALVRWTFHALSVDAALLVQAHMATDHIEALSVFLQLTCLTPLPALSVCSAEIEGHKKNELWASHDTWAYARTDRPLFPVVSLASSSSSSSPPGNIAECVKGTLFEYEFVVHCLQIGTLEARLFSGDVV